MRCSPAMGYLFVGISVVDEDRVITGGAPLIHIHTSIDDDKLIHYLKEHSGER